MSAAEILQAWTSRGVQARIDGNRVVLRAPRGLLGPEDHETLMQYRQELITLLMPDQDSPTCCCCGGPLPPGRTYRCSACDVPELPRVNSPCLVNGELRLPTGYQPTESLYQMAVNLGMNPELAARRYRKAR